MGAAMLGSAAGTHSRIPTFHQPPDHGPLDVKRSFREIAETISNRSFVALFMYAFFAAMAGGVSMSMSLYFSTFFWELQPEQIQYVVAANFPGA